MAKSNFGRNFVALRDSNGLTQQEMADKLGVTQTTISAWETRGKEPKNKKDFLKTVKEHFGVTESDLYGVSDGFYAKLHNLIPANASFPRQEPQKAYAPLLGRVHAGKAQAPDILDEHIPIPYEVWENHNQGYFLEVEGTCMSVVYPEGCRIFIDPDKQPMNGSIAVVSIDGADYVMRRMFKGTSTMILSPDSYDDSWDDIVIKQGDGHTVEIVGTVIWYQPKNELE